MILTRPSRSLPLCVTDWRFDEWAKALTHSPGLPVVLEDLEVEEDDEGEGHGNGGDEPVPPKAEKSSKSSE